MVSEDQGRQAVDRKRKIRKATALAGGLVMLVVLPAAG
jgi:hypothetical protein